MRCIPSSAANAVLSSRLALNNEDNMIVLIVIGELVKVRCAGTMLSEEGV